jgi:predicted metal-dependent hydrolase
MFQLAFDFLFRKKRVASPRGHAVLPPSTPETPFAWRHGIVVHLVRSVRSKRYLLRLQDDGSARLTIPRRGSRAEAIRFLERSEAWLRKRHDDWMARAAQRQPCRDGTRILFRGEEVDLRVELRDDRAVLSLAGETIWNVLPAEDYRPAVNAHLRALAERELPTRTRELAHQHGISIRSVTVRAQKTRWGSCSSRGAISLNWRLIEAPPFVVDYLIVHELMHRREMNHSARFWKQVAEAFPRYREAEAWLKGRRIAGEA